MDKPLYLTQYVKISALEDDLNIVDVCLKDHLINSDYLYELKCNCSHSHAQNNLKQPCKLVHDSICRKCNSENKIILSGYAPIFHPDYLDKGLYRCVYGCYHEHIGPCNQCINCAIGEPCMFINSIKCNYTTDSICKEHKILNKEIYNLSLLTAHHYDLRNLNLFVCENHKHFHKLCPNSVCKIQKYKCCDSSIQIKNLKISFVLTITNMGGDDTFTIGRKRKINVTNSQLTIYNPKFWDNQSENYFYSILRAVMVNRNMIIDRYTSFEKSKYTIGSIREFKSGKFSFMRQNVIGFSTTGVYQTSIIDCTIPYTTCIFPQKLYDLLEQEFDLNLIILKRDPSMTSTCMFVCKILRNQNADIETIIIPASIAKPLHQDQDGDRNGCFILPKYKNGYDYTKSPLFAIAKAELSHSFASKLSLISKPRISFSEYDLVMIERGIPELSENKIYKIIKSKGFKYALELGCSILSDEFNNFYSQLLEIYKRPIINCITIDDLLLKTNTINSIVSSGAKGTETHIKKFLYGISNYESPKSNYPKMITQFKNYIKASKELSNDGRIQFTVLYAAHDLTIYCGIVFLNKIPCANFHNSGLSFPFMYTEAALDYTLNLLEQ